MGPGCCWNSYAQLCHSCAEQHPEPEPETLTRAALRARGDPDPIGSDGRNNRKDPRCAKPKLKLECRCGTKVGLCCWSNEYEVCKWCAYEILAEGGDDENDDSDLDDHLVSKGTPTPFDTIKPFTVSLAICHVGV